MILSSVRITHSLLLAILLSLLTACGGGGGGGGGTSTAPVANFSISNASPLVNSSVTFDASASTGDISSYAWTFNGTNSQSGQTVSQTFATAGVYVVKLTVTNTEGTNASTERSITVSAPNQAPTANITPDKTAGDTPITVTFDASGSSDLDGTISQYHWDFDDGSTGTGQSVSHLFSNDGIYNVTLTVTDDDGATDTATVTITLSGAFESYSAVHTDDRTVQFGVVTNSDYGTITGWTWDFGDPSDPSPTERFDENPVHTYSSAGTYTVEVTVTFAGGSSTTSFDVVVADLKRIVVIGDSISHGSSGNPSYRYRLWKKLVEGGKVVDLLGTVSTLRTGGACSSADCPSITQSGTLPRTWEFDPDHQAQWGIRADQVLNGGTADGTTVSPLSTILNNAAYSSGADVAIIHLGTNDLIQGQTTTSTRDELQSIIDALFGKFGSGLQIYIAQIIPYTESTNTPNSGNVAALNTLIATLASSQANVTAVDQNTGYNSAVNNQSDGVHPNSTGEELMAQKWYDAIQGSL